MSVIATGFERAAAPPVAGTHAARRVLLWLFAALDRLVPPPRDAREDAGPPPEWFKYPPI
jgi:hypothetical protein